MNIFKRILTNGGHWVHQFNDLWVQQTDILKKNFADSIEEVLMPTSYPTDVPILFLNPLQLLHILKFLKEDPQFEYHFLSDLTASDEFPETPRFHVVYNLYSLSKKCRIRLKVKLKDGDSLSSSLSLWPGANWAEREVYDMFGISFREHPYMHRILTHSTFKGHALRKDYEIRQYQIPSHAEPIHPELLEP